MNDSQTGFKDIVLAVVVVAIIVAIVYLSFTSYYQNNFKTIETASASTVISAITDAEARQQLESANTCNYPYNWDRSDCVNDPEPKTSLKGIQQAVLTEVINFKRACDACSFEINNFSRS